MFTTVTTNAYQDQLNPGFTKVCEIFKVSGIESLKYVREFNTPVSYCGDISTHQNVTLNETNCDWLFDMSVKRANGGPWPINAVIYSRPSAISLKVWLRETNIHLTMKNYYCFFYGYHRNTMVTMVNFHNSNLHCFMVLIKPFLLHILGIFMNPDVKKHVYSRPTV